MPNIALVPNRATRIAALEAVVDGFPDISHSLKISTGGAPLETGARITDHAVAMPPTLELNGVVSNMRVITATADAGFSLHRPDPGADAWNALKRLVDDVEPVEVITPWAVYPEMLIRDATAKDTSGGMAFSLRLESILRVGARALPISTAATGPAAERQSEVQRGKLHAPAFRQVAPYHPDYQQAVLTPI